MRLRSQDGTAFMGGSKPVLADSHWTHALEPLREKPAPKGKLGLLSYQDPSPQAACLTGQ